MISINPTKNVIRSYDYYRRLFTDFGKNPPQRLKINIFIESFPDAYRKNTEDVCAHYGHHR